MDKIKLLNVKINNPDNNIFIELYGSDSEVVKEQAARYTGLLESFEVMSGLSDTVFFSSPGRTEIVGNHTDHNFGRVLAGAVNLDNVAIADKNNTRIIRIESGYSSFMFNQNIYVVSNVHEQGVSLALALSEMVLKGQGAWRVHGGGFAGTIQAFVPLCLVERYISTLQHVFGKGKCHKLFIREKGAVKVDVFN